MSNATLVAGPHRKIGRAELALIQVPLATLTHKPVPHHEIVEALIETLGFRHIGVVDEEYAVSNDGMKMFGVVDLETQMAGSGSRLDCATRTIRVFALLLQSATACLSARTWLFTATSHLRQCDS